MVTGGHVVIRGHGARWAAFCSCAEAPHVNTELLLGNSLQIIAVVFYTLKQKESLTENVSLDSEINGWHLIVTGEWVW